MRDIVRGTRTLAGLLTLALAACLAAAGCGGVAQGAGGKTMILNRGSDTMINVAQAWAEEYAKVEPTVSVEVAGGGSGVGIAALIDGTVELANSSRPLKPAEIEKAQEKRGVAPVEFVAGYDALVVYVHKGNPLTQVTLDQIQGMFAEGGPLTRWSDLGISNTACARDTIIRISRQSSSGTYDFFREIALRKHDFKLGTLELNGSKEVVELVSHTPCAIGYSGMGYATPAVKMLRVARDANSPYVEPTPAATLDGSYPIGRPLYLFTAGEPRGPTRHYIDWIMSDAGQRIVSRVGYVALGPRAERP
jgi:phosphate transport system substrate-binding protein